MLLVVSAVHEAEKADSCVLLFLSCGSSPFLAFDVLSLEISRRTLVKFDFNYFQI